MSDAVYREAVLASAPHAYWPLADGAGATLVAEIVGGRTGQVFGPVAFAAAADPWGAPAAAHFDGTGGQVVSVISEPADSGPFTIEAWYRVTGLGGCALVELNGSNIAATSGTYSPSLTLWSNNRLDGFCYGGSPSALEDPATSADGLWHHAVFVFDGTALILYRDGLHVATATGAVVRNGVQGFWRMGRGARISGLLLGDLAHIAVYNSVLTADDVAAHFAASQYVPSPPVVTTCVRKAWLTLPNGRTVGLEGPGWFCQKLDLGSPAVRDNVNNRPDRNGVLDQTMFLGARAVEANITTLVGAGARVDEVASQFGPFMDPALRPTLHYVLDRADNPERTLALRATGYSWPIIGDNQRDIQLQWSAPDPIARGTVLNLATAWTGTVGASGRVYNWTPDRIYPTGAGAPINGRLVSPGDVAFKPYLRIFGPVTAPRVLFAPDIGSSDRSQWPQIGFLPAFIINAGDFVGIDTENHTAYLNDNPALPVLDQVDWSLLSWPALDPAPNGWTMSMTGTSGMTASTQTQATWHDRYFA
jgi:hypothetical protein